MTMPAWVQGILERFDSKTEPHNEVDIAQALSEERAQHGDLSEEDWKYFGRAFGFLFHGRAAMGASAWGTYFAPNGGVDSGRDNGSQS